MARQKLLKVPPPFLWTFVSRNLSSLILCLMNSGPSRYLVIKLLSTANSKYGLWRISGKEIIYKKYNHNSTVCSLHLKIAKLIRKSWRFLPGDLQKIIWICLRNSEKETCFSMLLQVIYHFLMSKRNFSNHR